MLTKIIRWWHRYIHKLYSVHNGPQMIKLGDEWIFIDAYRNIYKIRYTGMYTGIPFDITLLHRN